MENKEDLCQRCLSANVCKWYNDIHKPVLPFEPEKMKVVVTKCVFFRDMGATQ